jgi:hypothetical protein
MCPMCGSSHLRAIQFDFGRDPTGYRDAGEGFRCLACGAEGDAEDAEPPRIPPGRENRLPEECALVTRRNA